MAKHWIQKAVKHPGVEKKAAKAAGESVHQYMEAHKNSPGKAGARARLGLRFEKGFEFGGIVPATTSHLRSSRTCK